MSFGTFTTGRRWLLRKALANDFSASLLSVGLYSNAANTLNERSVLADIVPITGTGYAAISLSAVGWTDAIILGATPPEDVVRFTRAPTVFTASSAWGTVRGAYLFDPAAAIAVAWVDASADYAMPTGAKYLADFTEDLF